MALVLFLRVETLPPREVLDLNVRLVVRLVVAGPRRRLVPRLVDSLLPILAVLASTLIEAGWVVPSIFETAP